MSEAIDYERLADAIAERIRPLDPGRMWTKADCMKYMQVSEAQFRRISANPTFPAPAHYPVGQTVTHPRYVASEVISFCERSDYRKISQAS